MAIGEVVRHFFNASGGQVGVHIRFCENVLDQAVSPPFSATACVSSVMEQHPGVCGHRHFCRDLRTCDSKCTLSEIRGGLGMFLECSVRPTVKFESFTVLVRSLDVSVSTTSLLFVPLKIIH